MLPHLDAVLEQRARPDPLAHDAVRRDRGAIAIVASHTPEGILARYVLITLVVAAPLVGWIRLAAERAGMVTAPVGVSVMVLAIVLTTATVMILAAARLERESRTARELERTVAGQRALLHVVMDQMPAGVIIAEAPNGRLIVGNRQAEEIWGRPMLASESLHAYGEWKGFHADGRPYEALDWPLARSLTTGEQVLNEDIRIMRSDGMERILMVSSAPVRDATGALTAGVVTFSDITDRARAEAERATLLQRTQEAVERAERANRIKEDFLAVLSHELRTPLNAILGWTHMLQRGHLRDALIPEALGTIERSARVQKTLIEDLLDISRIMSGRLRLDARPINLVNVVRAAIDTFTPAAVAKEIRIVSEFEREEAVAYADAHRLQQAVANLLSNAVKFTPAGGVVRVGVRRVGSHLDIVVGDTGIGIRPDFLPHVFERFRQADSTTTRSFEGLGLGLSIVRELIELHGGTVHAESAGVGHGATFTLRLPASSGSANGPQPEGSAALVQPLPLRLDGLTVMVVDDDPDTLKLTGTILRQEGATVVEVSSVSDAFALLLSNWPDVLLADIAMPDEDGYALISRLRELEKDALRWTPAAALTALASSEDRRKALLAGFQLHVPKPVTPDQLVLTVSTLAGRLQGCGETV